MKANELMLGDLLTFKDCLKDGVFTSIKVCELHDYNKDILVSIDGDTACDLIELDDEIVPIPLTPEILEKNGFIYNESPFVQGWEQFGLLLYLGGDGYRVNCGQNIALRLDSVHELQHALRLCGISKEIIL